MPVYRDEGAKHWRIQFRINGKNYVKSSKTSDKRTAERMEAEWKTKIHGQQYLGRLEEITVEEMLDNYLAQPLAAATLKGARSFKSVFGEFTNLKRKASDFDQKEIERFVQARLRAGKKESSIRTHLLVLSGAWNRVSKKLYNVPDLQLPKLKVPKFKTTYLSPDEEDQLLTYLLTRTPHAGGGTGEWQYEMHDVMVFLIDSGSPFQRTRKTGVVSDRPEARTNRSVSRQDRH